MSNAPNSFETIERPEKGDKTGHHEFRNVPDFYNPVYPTQAEFIFRANEVLTEFRKTWRETHADDVWAIGLEMDCIPVMSDGLIMGYMGVSEITGETYDYFPAKRTEVPE